MMKTKPKRLFSVLLVLMMILTLLPMTVLADEPVNITEVEVTGVAIPVAGQSSSTAGITVTTDPPGAVEDPDIYWMDTTELKILSPGDPFAEGHGYEIRLELMPKIGYAFSFDSTSAASNKPYTGKATVNGLEAEDARQLRSNKDGLFISRSPARIAAPTNPRWEGTVAKWDPVENAESYTWILLKDGEYLGISGRPDGSEAGTSADLSHHFSASGVYTFTVMAYPADDGNYKGSPESKQSPGYSFTSAGQLEAPTGIAWDTDGVTADWDEVQNADSYLINLYKDGSLIDTLRTAVNGGSTRYNLSSKFQGAGTYTFAVIAKGGGYDSSVESVKSEPKTITRLGTPANLSWDGAMAKWDAVKNAESYVCYLYKDGVSADLSMTCSQNSGDWLSAIVKRGAGTYSFSVRAFPDDEKMLYAESEKSENGPDFVYDPAAACIISFDRNGGQRSMSDRLAQAGTAFKLPENEFISPSGQKFKCWAIGSKDGKQVNAGETYTFTGDTTVYPVWEAGSEITDIDKVEIIGVPIPEVGETCAIDKSKLMVITASADAAYIYDAHWFDKTDWRSVAPTEKFIEGHEYFFSAVIEPNPGYAFRFNYDSEGTYKPYTGKVYVNGVKVNEASELFPGQPGLSIDGKPMKVTAGGTVVPEDINKVIIKGVQAPVAGRACSTDGITVITDPANAANTEINWFDETDGREVDGSTDKFIKDHEYSISFRLDPGPGYMFPLATDSTATPRPYDGTVTVNGEEADDAFGFGGKLIIIKAFGTAAGTPAPVAKITSVVIANVQTPAAGEPCATDAITITADPMGAVNVEEIYWWDATEHDTTDSGDRFIEGHEYCIHVVLEPKAGYTFEFDLSSSEMLKPYTGAVTVNGEAPDRAIKGTGSDTELFVAGKNAAVAVVEYKFTAGGGGIYTKGSGKTLEFTVDGPKDDCTGIKIDGVLIDASNYTLASGSTIITLKNAYLETLSVGEHTITAVYGDKETTASFKIAEAATKPSASGTGTTGQPASPKAGDDSSMALWISLMLVSIVGIVTACFVRIKKDRSR